jgi:hypothetical protein
VPEAQDAELFGWLTNLYLLWARLTPEMIRVSTQTAMAELMLSGCTTSSDHLYLFPNGARLDDSIEAADAMGMRFSCGARQHERGPQRGRAAARRGGRDRGSHPARQRTAHRPLARCLAPFDAPASCSRRARRSRSRAS